MTTPNMNEMLTPESLPFWRRISGRLIINSVLLAIVPLVVVVAITLGLQSRSIQSQIFNQLEAVNVLKSAQIEDWINNAHSDLRLITELRDLRDPLVSLFQRAAVTEEQQTAVNQQLENFANSSIFERVFIYDTEGNVIAASTDLLIGRVVSRQPYFANSLTAQHTEPPYYDVGNRELTLVVTQPLYSSGNVQIGVVAGSLNTEVLSDIMLNRTGLGDTGETYLVSLENSYLLTPSRFEGFEQNRAYNSLGIASGLTRDNGTAQYDSYRGVPVYGSYRWIPEIESVLLAEIDATEANAVIIQLFVVTVLIVIVVIALAVSFGLFTSLSISRPISELVSVALEITHGNLNERADISSRNEVGLLGQAFNQMTQQLNELIQNLEGRVQERTRDLSIASQVSQEVSRVLDMNELLPFVTELTKEGFELSHVSVFTYNNKSNTLNLAAGSGNVGRIMLEAGKQFDLHDKGLVPLAARNTDPQIINDVQKSPDHLVNPLLSETRSEVAIPMRVGTTLIGVLDLQSNEVDHFTDAHVEVLTTLADQIAVALRNAQLFLDAEAARQEAEQANVVKSQFLAAMSHELRTPLNAVLNFTQFVSTGMLGEVNNEQVEMLDKVVESGKHLLGLINDVLDISKIEAGALKLFVEDDVDLAHEAETVIASAKVLVAEKPVTLETDIESDIPLINGDKRRLRQIMLNLASNACKFTDEGIVTISLKREDNNLVFAVSDTGAGIAPEDHELIFETFRQTSGGLRQGEGTGLGLPISRRLAETHGGNITLESVVGEGTTFYMSIPINNPELTPTAKRKETPHVA